MTLFFQRFFHSGGGLVGFMSLFSFSWGSLASQSLHLGRLILLLVVEGVGDFLASVEWAYEDEEGSASHDEAEGTGGCVAFVICGRVSVISAGATAYSVSNQFGKCNGRLGSAYSRSGGRWETKKWRQGGENIPRSISWTSSSTRFINWS